MLSASAAVEAVAAGTATVSDIADDALRTVAALDTEIGAFRIVDADAVRRQADGLDAFAPRPLTGVVIGIKDVIDTADLPTGYGSPLFNEHQPTADAAVVASCRQAGALVLGKTESTEFAMFQPTRTRNPLDVSRTPGGSSSGSAAAVAVGMVPVALGTQTAGSVIRPAAYCGTYGFKPTRGWTSTDGVWRLTESFDTIGLFARTAADLALTYQAIRDASGPDGAAAVDTSDRVPRRVAVLAAAEWGSCEPDVAMAIAAVTGQLREAGWEIRQLAMPEVWRDLPDVHSTLMAVEVARNMRERLGDRVDKISASARAIVERGDNTSADVTARARSTRQAAADALAELAGSTDLLLAPSALGVAPTGLDFTGDPVMCRPWTLLCAPATNVPAYFRPDGLPVGVQAVGVQLNDVTFMTALASLEAALANKE
jgi:Asp-tRNA(Asn)/Glu-tRNA(Gln) amidotransferase A subunit family amidase